MAPIKQNGMSDYEMQRAKNMEENRRILESIRQEQIYKYEALQPVKQKERKPAEPRPKKKPRVETVGGPEGVEAETNISGIRKSSRISGKTAEYSRGLKDEDSDDKDYEEEYYDDDSDEEDGEGRKRKRVRGPQQKIVIPKNRVNFYGAVPGVEIGRIWEMRMQCSADGVMRPPVAGIHGGPEGAYSIALSGGYEDDVDLGDCFTYTGEGGRALSGTKAKPKNLRTAPQSKDQTLTKGNLALSLNIETRKPVRVIRGYKSNTEFSPEYGYRYDGLYSVEKYWLCVGKSGFKVYKFALRRCPDQAPPPWVTNKKTKVQEEPVEKKEDDKENCNNDLQSSPSPSE
ncbi:uncharacterized protein LOC130703563 [Daphnia carinata]|uniref:uncharacterized protein LOC130703563 n=1 Tax=Daphnia carinata TaxID=120202 RepID=UPI00257DFC18|nr:uncharacterized protein LOC130703563 [Daphnia carinata]